jgi:hypothetical protein
MAMILSQNLLSGVLTLPYTLAFVLLLMQFGSYDFLLSGLAHPATYLTLFVTIGAFMCLAQLCMLALVAVCGQSHWHCVPWRHQ